LEDGIENIIASERERERERERESERERECIMRMTKVT
jgi:hypothetical protein